MKYLGSKKRIARHFLPLVLKGRKPDQYFVEPFVGGANVTCEVSGLRIGADTNKYLIALLVALQDGWIPPSDFSEKDYNEIKHEKTEVEDHLRGYLKFCLSFRGIEDIGFARTTILKSGKVDNYILAGKKSVDNLSKYIRNVKFFCCSYEKLQIPANSIIYCDPPYRGSRGYTKGGGPVEFDHEKFYEWCFKMKSLGHKVFISEYAMPDRFSCVWQKEISVSINPRHTKRVIEKLFVPC